ncbi:hypothetical protein JW988_07780 [Candidatus Bathyarchaeota archaeon]|nr:hypothetical protein [Candidatus Bathyarchaeota archaeon]
MNRSSVIAVAVCAVVVFSLVLSHYDFTHAANTSVTVLSYSSYYTGNFIIVGEVQNTGSHALESVSLNIVVSASDGTQIAAGTTNAGANEFLPQQKAPFYIDLGKINSDTLSKVSTFNISVSNAPPTNYNQYQDLSLNVDFNGIVNDVYVVSGSITNTGNQTANNIKIYGTYYNSAGVVVAVGLFVLKDPLTPKTSASFTVDEFDASPHLVNKISNYALLVQTSTQIFATPSAPSTTSPSDSPQSSDISWLIFGVVGVVAIVFGVGLLVYFRKRKH